LDLSDKGVGRTTRDAMRSLGNGGVEEGVEGMDGERG